MIDRPGDWRAPVRVGRHLVPPLDCATVYMLDDGDRERPVSLHYTAREGCAATWFDPPEAAEFEIWFVTWDDPDTGRHTDITDAISDAQREAWDAELYETHDFDRYSDDW